MEKVLKSVMEAHQAELDEMKRQHNDKFIAMQKQVKSLQEKNNKLYIEKEALYLEKTWSREQAVRLKRAERKVDQLESLKIKGQEMYSDCKIQLEEANTRLSSLDQQIKSLEQKNQMQTIG